MRTGLDRPSRDVRKTEASIVVVCFVSLKGAYSVIVLWAAIEFEHYKAQNKSCCGSNNGGTTMKTYL